MAASIIESLKISSRNSPGASAVVFRGAHYSYAQLDQLSDRIGLALQERGISARDKVGVYLEKSLQALACIYGVLKTGACYVPLSPSDPAVRTAYMLESSGTCRMLFSAPLRPDLTRALVAANLAALEVDELLSDARDPMSTFTFPSVSSKDCAAILHTSGSTGNPKGAMITHGNLAVFLDWAIHAFNLHGNDCLLSHAPLQFDLSFFDVFAAAAAGATVVLAEAADTCNASRMARLVNEAEVTVWQSVPSALSLQNMSGRSVPMPGVRHVLFAGESMPRQTLLRLPELFPRARLHNVYGCTETNDSFMYSLPRDIHESPDPLPIGQALPHTRYRIVDQFDQDVAPGVAGHLMISGETVMAGYVGTSTPGKGADSYYRTNDLVLEAANGLLQFLGRIDSVVKINGYRVNLTEIEAWLQHSGRFEEVASFCVDDSLLGQRIVVAVKIPLCNACSPLELKTYCAGGLPRYAIPHSFYITDKELPKGSTGKIDRQRISHLWRQQHPAGTTGLLGE